MENIFLLKWRMEMTKILIFPFLSISTGHHHVADSLQTELLLKSHHCEKIDIFSHAYRRLEKASSAAYLSWIQYFPKVYSSVYHLLACGRHETAKGVHTWSVILPQALAGAGSIYLDRKSVV